MKIETADDMIAKYGDQAYHRSISYAVISEGLNDREGAQHFAVLAKELMERGYHKHPKRSDDYV